MTRINKKSKTDFRRMIITPVTPRQLREIERITREENLDDAICPVRRISKAEVERIYGVKL